MGVIIVRYPRIRSVAPVDLRLGRSLFDPFDIPLEIGVAAGEIDEDPVELVASLQAYERVREGIRPVPDVNRRTAGMEEIVANGELAEHGYPIGLSEGHRDLHPFSAVHRAFVRMRVGGSGSTPSGARSESASIL